MLTPHPVQFSLVKAPRTLPNSDPFNHQPQLSQAQPHAPNARQQPFSKRFHKRTGEQLSHCYTFASKKFGVKAASTDLTSSHVAEALLSAADSHSHHIAMETDYQSQQIARFQLQATPTTVSCCRLLRTRRRHFCKQTRSLRPLCSTNHWLPTTAAASDLDVDCRSEYFSRRKFRICLLCRFLRRALRIFC